MEIKSTEDIKMLLPIGSTGSCKEKRYLSITVKRINLSGTGSYRFAAKDQKLITCSACKVFLLDRLFRFLYNHSGMVMICF